MIKRSFYLSICFETNSSGGIDEQYTAGGSGEQELDDHYWPIFIFSTIFCLLLNSFDTHLEYSNGIFIALPH